MIRRCATMCIFTVGQGLTIGFGSGSSSGLSWLGAYLPETSKTGWALLHSKLPSVALHVLPQSAYGVAGLTDVNEAYLIQRLFASGLTWDWRLLNQEYLGFEDRAVRDKDYTTRYYLASVQGELSIDGRIFHGAG